MITQTDDNTAANHGCEHSWCVNDSDNGKAQRLEHFTPSTHLPATGDSLSRPSHQTPHGEPLVTVGVGARWNQDLDPAPVVWLEIEGGWRAQCADAAMQITEAVLLHAALGKVIEKILGDFESLDVAEISNLYIGGMR